MIKPSQIPDEVIDTVCDGSTDELFKQGMRWMIAAAINAWPGGKEINFSIGDLKTHSYSLPLPQEKNDE